MELKNLESVLTEYTYYLKDYMIDNEKSLDDLKPQESVKVFLNQWKKRIEEKVKKELKIIEAKKKQFTKS